MSLIRLHFKKFIEKKKHWQVPDLNFTELLPCSRSLSGVRSGNFFVTAANFCLRKRGGTLYKPRDAFGSFLKFDYALSHALGNFYQFTTASSPHILWKFSTGSQLQVHNGGNKWTDPITKEGRA